MSDPTRHIVLGQLFASKLSTAKNLAKPSWVTMSDDEVRRRIVEEIRELLAELEKETLEWIRVVDEAADVYNFSLMGLDFERRKLQGPWDGPV